MPALEGAPGPAWFSSIEFQERVFGGAGLLATDAGLPTLAQLVEGCSTDGLHLVAPGSDTQLLASGVLGVGDAFDVAEMLMCRDGFRRGLLGDPESPPEGRSVVRAFIDGPESELMGGSDSGVALPGELGDNLLDHPIETLQQEQCQAGS